MDAFKTAGSSPPEAGAEVSSTRPTEPQEAISAAGRRVTLRQECGTYAGARPYFTVTRFKVDGQRPGHQRYTPSLAQARAYFEAFCEDITDPAELKARADAA